MRWFWWFGVVPQLFLLAGYLHDLGLPPVDVSVFGALFLAWFAQVRALPVLLLALAVRVVVPVAVVLVRREVAEIVELRLIDRGRTDDLRFVNG